MSIVFKRTSIFIVKRSVIMKDCTQQICTNQYRRNIKERQKEIMARGLPKKKPIDGVKQIIIVSSTKGGVGKSTTSVNLAIALKNITVEKSIGLLDADVYGPSIPLMMNLNQAPNLNSNNMMEPLINYGIKCMSMGFLISKESPVIWRGLMVMSAIDKLLRQVAWGDVDYLIIDTPPGTGDTHLSLFQNLPIAGVLIVTTPQTIALEITRRGANMYKKLNVPLLGIVENMANVTCPNCHCQVPIFKRNTKTLASDLGTSILCEIPLDERIALGSDQGKPVVLTVPDSIQSMEYKKLAQKVVKLLDR